MTRSIILYVMYLSSVCVCCYRIPFSPIDCTVCHSNFHTKNKKFTIFVHIFEFFYSLYWFGWFTSIRRSQCPEPSNILRLETFAEFEVLIYVTQIMNPICSLISRSPLAWKLKWIFVSLKQSTLNFKHFNINCHLMLCS